MDFELSDDQVALRDAAKGLLDDLASPARVRAHLADGSPFDDRLWSAMVEQGWLDPSLGYASATPTIRDPDSTRSTPDGTLTTRAGKSPFPAQYAAPTTSPLRVPVRETGNVLNLDLVGQ